MFRTFKDFYPQFDEIVLIEFYLNYGWLYPNLELLKSILELNKLRYYLSTSFYAKISIFLLSMISKNVFSPLRFYLINLKKSI